MNRKLSVIVPAYQESHHIRENVTLLMKTLRQLNRPYEVILVCDGCEHTWKAVRDFASDELKIYYYEHNAGKGYALKYGVDRATGALVTFIDADMSIDPNLVASFIEIMDAADADIVIGSKRHPRSKVSYPMFRRLQSFVYQTLIALLFQINVKDTQTGLKLFRRDVLLAVLPRVLVKAYAFDLELLVIAHRLGYQRVVEAPIAIKQQFSTTTNLKAAWRVLLDTFAIFYRLRVLKFYDRDHIFIDMEGAKPKVSIIIPMRGCPRLTEYLQFGYGSLAYYDYEILIIGDEPSDEQPIESHIKYLAFGNKLPTEKRELAAKVATGDILAFIDDDAVPKTDWLNNAVRHFHIEKVAAIGGPAVTPPNSSLREIASGAVYESRLGSGPLFYHYIPGRPKEVIDYDMVNFLIRANVFELVGGFATNTWPGEGRMLCASVIREGLKVVYDPDVIVYHKRQPLFIPHLKKISEHAFKRGYLVRHSTGYLNNFGVLLPSIFVIGLLLGPVVGILGGLPLIMFTLLEGMYLCGLFIAGFWTAFVRQNLAVGALIIPGIMTTHLTYGIFFLRGFLSRRAV